MRKSMLAWLLPFVVVAGIAAAQPNVWHVVNGVLTGPGFVATGQIQASDGSAAAPSYSFASEPTFGIWLNTASTLGFGTTNNAMYWDGTFLYLQKDTAGIFWGAGNDVSLSRGAANRLDLATADSFNLVGGGGSFQMAAVPIISSTAPTVSSAGTSPSVSGTNTAAFRVNVGTGGTATAVVMTMPAATTGWNCFAENITATTANRGNQRVVLIGSTTTSVTVENQTISTGAALAFTASDIVAFQCMAY